MDCREIGERRKRMHAKKACLIINPHAGENAAHISELLAVLSAAGWRTSVALKGFGGQSMELASKAVKAHCDLIIGYGGDGTLNQVLNGVMRAGEHSSAIGVIPGGTANVWATEIGVPSDPVKAALVLVNSEVREIDIGYVEVQGLAFPDMAHDEQERERQKKARSGVKQHFLLMAGLGLDATIMEHVSRSFKYKVGPLAVGLAAAEELPRQRPFPLEIRISGVEDGNETVWEGKALQVVVGNTRRYANIVQMTSGAYLDDGLLDVCVITAGNALTTLEEIASLLFRRRSGPTGATYFRGANITIRVPASIDLQLDGSAVKLKDYLSTSDSKALQNGVNAEQVMVTYRFDALPCGARVAIPSTYDGALFQQLVAEEGSSDVASQRQRTAREQQQHGEVQEVLREPPELLRRLAEDGYKVTVRGAAKPSGKHHRYILAGTVHHRMTGDTRPVAIRIERDTLVLSDTGEHIPLADVLEVQEGAAVIAVGKKSKREVIRATHLLLSPCLSAKR
jgi:YegS/Rv2252/BmrU family lipid kinase